MIQLTRIDVDNNRHTFNLDADSIEQIEDHYKGAEITTKRLTLIVVVESRQEVARKVLEYRLAMLNYADGLFKPDAEEHLMKLSGLSAEKGAEG